MHGQSLLISKKCKLRFSSKGTPSLITLTTMALHEAEWCLTVYTEHAQYYRNMGPVIVGLNHYEMPLYPLVLLET